MAEVAECKQAWLQAWHSRLTSAEVPLNPYRITWDWMHLVDRTQTMMLNDAGEVIGIRAEREGRDFYAGARRGVVIATGGFEWNQELVKAVLKGEVTHPRTPPYNDGDGLIMAMETGASVGMQTLDQCLKEMLKKGVIPREEAILKAKMPETF